MYWALLLKSIKAHNETVHDPAFERLWNLLASRKVLRNVEAVVEALILINF